MSKQVKVFDYIPELDAFQPTKEYAEIATGLGLVEWTPVVWIGRLFTLDNDYGEHWFDNWDERHALREKARKLGYEADCLYIVVPSRFKDGANGPCHTDSERKAFWTDALKSLSLDLETLITFAIGSAGEHPRGYRKFIKQLREREVLHG